MALAARVAAMAAGLRRDLARTARRDRALHAIALTVFLTGFAMQPYTGLHPDWDVVGRVFVKLGMVGAMAAAGLVIWRLGWLALVARSTTPTRDLLDWVGRFLAGPGLAANAASTILIFCLYAGGFSVLKGAIAVVSPFAWDAALADLDRALHFGRLPHEWLPALTRPLPLAVLNVGYNVWFFLLVGGWLGATVAVRRPGLRHQYPDGLHADLVRRRLSRRLRLLVGRPVLLCPDRARRDLHAADAGAASSRGRLRHLGGRHAEPPLGRLHRRRGPDRPASRRSRPCTWRAPRCSCWRPATSAAPPSRVAAAYWVMILLGSVLLGWHYAVDGYAAALIAVLVWRFAGRYGQRAGIVERDPVPAG